MDKSNIQTTMGLIIDGGNAKSSAFEAIKFAKKGKFSEAQKKLKEADDFLAKAHNYQTQMLTAEANGKHHELTLLMVHAQDHVMNAITFKELANEMVDLYKKIL